MTIGRHSSGRLLRHLGEMQFVRFLVIGLLNTLFGYGCFVLLLYLGLHYALALLIATVIGILFNFMTTGRLVFRSDANHLLLRFVGVYLAVYTVNVAGLKALSQLGWSGYMSGAVLLLPVAALSYFLNKKFVFVHG